MSKIDPAILILKGKWEKAESENKSLRAENEQLRAVLYQARSTADNHGARAGIEVIEDYLEETGDE